MESNTIKQPPSVESPAFPRHGPPPILGRRPPPSGPPPIPSRVDLGEAPVDVASSIKKQSRDGFPYKGSPKLKYEGIKYLLFISKLKEVFFYDLDDPKIIL